MNSHFDVIVVGAGLSGIGAAYYIQEKCKSKTFTILEAREKMGGTWDLFKYPGLRSDSDMYTFGFPFHPWKDPKAIADGKSILEYIKDTAQTFKIDQKIQYDRRVTAADWNSETKQWSLEVSSATSDEMQMVTCSFLMMCCGYYNYKEAYTPEFKGLEKFTGKVVHPQFWDTELNYTDKEIVIIGSGATAITLVPELSKKAKKVTMLQRSPTYIMNLPSEDIVANFLRKVIPNSWAHHLVRWKNILLSILIYSWSRKAPKSLIKLLKRGIKKALGKKYIEKDFTPKYGPWDQRLCLVPDADFFEAMKAEKAHVITDTIADFHSKGVLTDSGINLNADILITATGLKIQLLGGATVSIDGKTVNTAELLAYRGVMFSGVPNFAVAIGYTNASWTLKCDLNCRYLAKVLNYMDENGKSVVIPQFDETEFETERLLDFDAGYILRAKDVLPKQGSASPWKVHQNYIKDLLALNYGKVNDQYLVYH
ncbi:flavin-containing monooxygenase [Croceivirga thetidis]|uniref:NAD(P)/FAD-dependent oxidoreductase n=1 Tax=Croceivirga thetidis TaxID=2721623 RepID=A0ABX1GU19_9FLAO|nr:NAD(P)/FAD-dependent oxidoreductase [Croceivirga thetidis]NKI32415.1 NAD(P)/FAD-dependent oxidoreductase [Croceivirga thetidis]